MDDHTDIQEVLGGGSAKLTLGNASLDDSALEQELDELLQIDEAAGAADREKHLDESIERRLQELNINGFADLSIDEQRQIVSNSVGSIDELLRIQMSDKAAKPSALWPTK